MSLRDRHIDWLKSFICQFTKPPPTQSVTDWCCENLRFSEPKNCGPFSVDGAEYIREPLDSWSDRTVSQLTLCWGSQTRKTGTIMGGNAWVIEHDPSRFLWVMPGKEKAAEFSSTRFQPMIKASPPFRDKIPRGAERHNWSKCHMAINGSIIDMIGSNSPGQLSSNPVNMVVCDETDKFADATEEEADAVELAFQRTKHFTTSKKICTSTPTHEFARIWRMLRAGDMRRYFLPCPFCGKDVVFAWSKEFTDMPILGNEAFITWCEKEKPEDPWDLDRVKATAFALCPHCKGQIRDGHKHQMLKLGHWVATNKDGEPGHRSYHLPSLYSTSPECRFGNLAVKQLSGSLQGFINGDLAEPWRNQVSIDHRTEHIVTGETALEGKTTRILTSDVQLVSPFFWWTIMDWSSSGDSRVIAIGKCDSVDDLRKIQTDNKIIDIHVTLDASNNQSSVVADCMRFGEKIKVLGKDERGNAMLIDYSKGWKPAKGMPRRRWFNKKVGIYEPFFYNTKVRNELDKRSKIQTTLFEFSGDICKDILFTLRQHLRTKTRMEFVESVCTDEFWRHMEAEHVVLKQCGYRWELRNKKLPNHWFDSIVLQIATALYLRILKVNADYVPAINDNTPKNTKESTQPEEENATE